MQPYFEQVFKKAEQQGVLNSSCFEFTARNNNYAVTGQKFNLLKEVGETIEIEDFDEFLDKCINAGILIDNGTLKYIR